jgi:LemA protein
MNGFLITVLLVIIVLYLILLYNNIIRKRNETDNAFGSVDAMLKKRYDLLPNLIEIVKQYTIHEASTLSDITKLRAGLTENLSNEARIRLHNDISRQLDRIMITAENYPDLKASQNFLKLQGSWNETEEQISASRRFFNSTVTDYNNAIQTFPASILADIFKFSPMNVLETKEQERQNISAKDLFRS